MFYPFSFIIISLCQSRRRLSAFISPLCICAPLSVNHLAATRSSEAPRRRNPRKTCRITVSLLPVLFCFLGFFFFRFSLGIQGERRRHWPKRTDKKLMHYLSFRMLVSVADLWPKSRITAFLLEKVYCFSRCQGSNRVFNLALEKFAWTFEK